MAQIYRFDDVEIDLPAFRVLKAGKSLALEPKALNLLVFLVENRGRLVEKRELLDAVWGEAFVTENVLTRVIAQLRKALADGGADTRYIETVPTKGYRFIAELIVEDAPESPSSVSISPTESPVPAAMTETRPPKQSRLRLYVAATIVLAACVAAVIVVMQSRSKSQYFQIASSAQITTSSGLSFYPTFSPDNTQIAYSTDRGKGFEIYVRQLAPGGKEFQITSDGDQNMQPAWSPDGSFIAYYSRIRGGIWIMPALGGPARKLTDFGSHPSWSRDGQWIAFESGSVNDLSSDSTGIGIPSVIWGVRPDGSDARKITSPGQPDGGHGAPSWSPDGKHIVFVASYRGISWMWAIGADGTGLTMLGDRGNGYYDPVYSFDGKSVIYGAAAPGQNVGLWQLRVSPDTSAALGPPAQILNSGANRIRNLTLSSDGKKLLYASVGLTGGLQSLPVSKSVDPAGEPVSLMSDVGCRDILPMFSPDGSRIAFVSCHGRVGTRQQIWLVNGDGTDLQQLTAPQNSYVDPNWYPDGRHLMITANINQLISVDADTRQQKTVYKMDRDFSGGMLSPDGGKVAMNVLTNGIQNVWSLDLANGNLKQLSFDMEDAGYPTWSPDGKWIAYESEKGPDNAVAVVAADGGKPIDITPYQGQHWVHAWSPDGDKILYAKPGDDFVWNIWSVSRVTKIETQLTHYRRTNAYVRYPTMSSRGNQIVYEYTETTGNIWMSELK